MGMKEGGFSAGQCQRNGKGAGILIEARLESFMCEFTCLKLYGWVLRVYLITFNESVI